MQDENLPFVKNILLKLAEHVKVKGIRGLAAYLEIPENRLYSWISRNSIGDSGAILNKVPNVRLEWLETGKGEMFTGTRQEEAVTELSSKQVIAKKALEEDEILEFILGLEETPELRLLIRDLKGKSPDEVLDYIRAGRKAFREGKDK